MTLSYCALLILHVLRIEGLQQPCIEQVCWCHFSNRICLFSVSVLHFGNLNISEFSIIIFVVVIHDNYI